MMEQKTILVVEDELPMLRALSDKLARVGYAVLSERNGEDGLQTALKKRPDLILLDLLMPKMDGMTVMKKLREDAWGRKVPIIILTNFSMDDKIMKGVTADEPAYYLMKAEVKIEEIVEKIRQVLGS